MYSREQRIVNLATTLKTSGIAKSESQARMMAEEMIGVEEHVQKNYEGEHAKAQEFLNTAKNLRSVPQRQEIKPIPVERVEPRQEQRSAPTYQNIVPTIDQLSEQKKPAPEYTDTNFGHKSLSQAFSEHDTHNNAIEAIKEQMSHEHIVSLEDRGTEFDDTPAHTEIPRALPSEEPQHGEQLSEAPKLDAQRLVEMMEEDGKLEEHTREIKEKPKDVKPKEEYAENNIDLNNMFNFGKR